MQNKLSAHGQKNTQRPDFRSAQHALKELRLGKENPKWLLAASFLIERANPDAALLLEAAQMVAMSKYRQPTAEPIMTWLPWIIVGALSAGLVFAMVFSAIEKGGWSLCG